MSRSLGIGLLLLVLVSTAGAADKLDYNYAHSNGGSHSTKDGIWHFWGEYSSIQGFAPRPKQIPERQIQVSWKPFKLDDLGNVCTIAGRLTVPGKKKGTRSPINWFQGIGVYVGKAPGKRLNWSRGIHNDKVAFHKSVVLDPNGEFQFKVDLRDTGWRRQGKTQRLQVGLSLAKHKKLFGKRQRITWLQTQPVVASSVRMMSIPAPKKLSHEMLLINAASRWPFLDQDTSKLIRAVNALRKLGKDKSLATLTEYTKVLDTSINYDEGDIVFWIIRVLFAPPKKELHPPAMVAVYLIAKTPDWPLNPLAVSDGLPFMVGRRIGMGGMPEHPLAHIKWARKHGTLRTVAIVPQTNPVLAAQRLLTSKRFQKLPKFVRQMGHALIQQQALAMLGHKFDWTKQKEMQQRWQKLLKQAQTLKVRWDPKRDAFVR